MKLRPNRHLYLNARLCDAAEYDDKNTVMEMLRSGINVNSRNPLRNATALYVAASNANLDIVAFLLHNGAHVNDRGPDNNTSLHVAAYLGNPDLTRLLLESGADCYAKNSHNQIPIDVAWHYGAKKVYYILQDHMYQQQEQAVDAKLRQLRRSKMQRSL